jgi:hypothetical protein
MLCQAKRRGRTSSSRNRELTFSHFFPKVRTPLLVNPAVDGIAMHPGPDLPVINHSIATAEF